MNKIWDNIIFKLQSEEPLELDDEELCVWQHSWKIASKENKQIKDIFIPNKLFTNTKQLEWSYLKLPILSKYSQSVTTLVEVLINLLNVDDIDVILFETVLNIINSSLIGLLKSQVIQTRLLQKVNDFILLTSDIYATIFTQQLHA